MFLSLKNVVKRVLKQNMPGFPETPKYVHFLYLSLFSSEFCHQEMFTFVKSAYNFLCLNTQEKNSLLRRASVSVFGHKANVLKKMAQIIRTVSPKMCATETFRHVE
jgi:hypothetical protein